MTGVITYNIPHRKTYDVLCLLKAKGINDVAVFAEPPHYKKTFKPLIEHRPSTFNGLTPQALCGNFSFKYYESSPENILPPNSKILLCGSGIIPDELINRYKIINSHPGYLPNVRGLDALKWAIYDGQPIGVTVHQLGEYIDAGLIIERKLVPIYFNDTFHSVAQRQYEMEINMLADAIFKIETATEFASPQNYPLRKRMPRELETRIFKRFDDIVQSAAIDL
jgi:phosphoribosylglycinamide formyltransferase-1